VTQQTPAPQSRLLRFLAYIVAGLVVLSLICIFAAFIAGALGQSKALANGDGVWRLVETIPAYALPVAFVVLIACFIVLAVSKSRANRAGISASPEADAPNHEAGK
jgi:TRAP-type C4-dicarboxylate transport system permease small subunit